MVTSRPFAGGANFLIRADQRAQAASICEITSELESMEDAATLCAAMSWPYLRPLLELQINDAGDASGGLILLALGYARTEKIIRNFRSEMEKEFSVICLTQQGICRLNELYHYYEGDRWFAALDACVADYACIDLGAGIALGADFLTSSITNDEFDVLRRVITPDGLRYQFPNLIGISDAIIDQDVQGKNALDSRIRPSATPNVILANFGLESGSWSKRARDVAADLITDLICMDAPGRSGFVRSS